MAGRSRTTGSPVAGASSPPTCCRAFVSQKLRPFLVSPTLADLEVLKGLIEAGKLTPVVDRAYPLSQTSQAIDHVGLGHTRGKVAITV